MTEAEWLTSTDPAAMLTYLRVSAMDADWVNHPGSKWMRRKLRLWACACCRQVWDGTECRWCKGSGDYEGPSGKRRKQCPNCHGTGRVGGLTDPRSRRAVEVAERFADGLATERELGLTWEESPQSTLLRVLWSATRVLTSVPSLQSLNECGVPPATQAALLRCLFGNHFQAVKVRPEWLRWNDGTVRRLAEGIYQDRAFNRMGILHDALLDSGCDDEELLRHCRGQERCRHCDGGGVLCEAGGMVATMTPEQAESHIRYGDDRPCNWCLGEGAIELRCPHVRGCWALDLILGKE